MKPLLNNSKERWMLGAVLVAMGAVVAWLTSLNPLRYDDLMYQYMCMDTGDGMMHFNHDYRIESIGDALVSMKNWYQLENGRILVHFIVQCFCGFMGKGVFNVINGIAYIAFLYSCLRWLKVQSLKGSLIVIGVLWLALPVQYIFTVSIAYAVNYLWVATLMICFLLVLRYNSETTGKENNVLILMMLMGLGLLTGATHEGFMFPLSVATFCFMICNRHRLNKQIVCLILGLWIGTATVVFAPATIQRSNDSMAQQSINFSDWLMLKAHVLIYSKRVIILLLSLVVVCFVLGHQKFMGIIREYLTELVTIAMGLVFVALLPHYSQRMVFPAELLAVLILLSLLWKISFLKSHLRTACATISLLTLIHVAAVSFYSHRLSKAYHQMVENYIETTDGEPQLDTPSIPKFVFPYIKLPDEFEYKMIVFEYGSQKSNP